MTRAQPSERTSPLQSQPRQPVAVVYSNGTVEPISLAPSPATPLYGPGSGNDGSFSMPSFSHSMPTSDDHAVATSVDWASFPSCMVVQDDFAPSPSPQGTLSNTCSPQLFGLDNHAHQSFEEPSQLPPSFLGDDATAEASDMFQLDDLNLGETFSGTPFNLPDIDMVADPALLGGSLPEQDPCLSTSLPEKPLAQMPRRGSLLSGRRPRATSITLPARKALIKAGRRRGFQYQMDKKHKVHAMRLIGVCHYCKWKKRECDLETPCKTCIHKFGPGALEGPNQCRHSILAPLKNLILSDTITWHPREHSLVTFFPFGFVRTSQIWQIPLLFNFGPAWYVNVQVVRTHVPVAQIHEHVNYTEPALEADCYTTTDYVVPVVAANEDEMQSSFNSHLECLAEDHVGVFQLPGSNFRLLAKIHDFYGSLKQENAEYASLLQLALKLLVLVKECRPAVDAHDETIQYILREYVPGYSPQSGHGVSPCLIRSQLGGIAQRLAQSMLDDLLRRLFHITLSRKKDQFPLVVAVYAVIMMTLETLTYYGLRKPYHGSLDFSMPDGSGHAETGYQQQNASASVLSKTEEAASILLRLYRICFSNCHRYLIRCIEQNHFPKMEKDFGFMPAQFVQALSAEIAKANGYIEHKSNLGGEALGNVSQVFEWLVPKLLVLKTK